MTIAVELRDRLKLRYAGNCKCGHCALVPDELVARAADEIEKLAADLKTHVDATVETENRIIDAEFKATAAEFDLAATLKAVLFFFGPEGANKVTTSALEARALSAGDDAGGKL